MITEKMQYMQNIYNKITSYEEYNNAITAQHLPLFNYYTITVALEMEDMLLLLFCTDFVLLLMQQDAVQQL